MGKQYFTEREGEFLQHYTGDGHFRTLIIEIIKGGYLVGAITLDQMQVERLAENLNAWSKIGASSEEAEAQAAEQGRLCPDCSHPMPDGCCWYCETRPSADAQAGAGGQ
jgi:hypothetical protein